MACCLAAGCCLSKLDAEVDKLASSDPESEGDSNGSCLSGPCNAARESFQEIFPDGPVPAVVLGEIKEIEEFSKGLTHEFRMKTAQDEFDDLLNRSQDDFERKQRELNYVLREARKNATEIVRSKNPIHQVTVKSSQELMQARSAW